MIWQKLFLIQMHQGEYICRADNGVGPGQEAMVKLYIQGGILTGRIISLVLLDMIKCSFENIELNFAVIVEI